MQEENAARSTQHAARSTQHAARSTQHAARSTHHTTGQGSRARLCQVRGLHAKFGVASFGALQQSATAAANVDRLRLKSKVGWQADGWGRPLKPGLEIGPDAGWLASRNHRFPAKSGVLSNEPPAVRSAFIRVCAIALSGSPRPVGRRSVPVLPPRMRPLALPFSQLRQPIATAEGRRPAFWVRQSTAWRAVPVAQPGAPPHHYITSCRGPWPWGSLPQNKY
jgi:hypothetical protein